MINASPADHSLHQDADAQARLEALDPTRSFIVQAPAGSGKTTLLTQRCLSLLSKARVPEEVLAITFTVKAAAEMRGRVLGALEAALKQTPVSSSNEQTTRDLAIQVLAQGQRQGWSLTQDPGRLRMQTFDSLNQWLASRLPILAGTGAAPKVCLEPQALYAKAANQVLSRLDEASDFGQSLTLVLAWLDNEVGRFIELIAQMLSRRDQWLRHVADGELARDPAAVRARLESALEEVIVDGLKSACAVWPEPSRALALEHLHMSLSQAPEDQVTAAQPWLTVLAGLPELDARVECRQLWERTLTLLLTKAGELRRTVTKNEGFPPTGVKAKEAKAAFIEYLQSLQAIPQLAPTLAQVRKLPPQRYGDEQWDVLKAIVSVLTGAAATLELVFAQQGEVDFVAVSRAALQSLGGEGDPSDFALRLDYRLQHLLVDEFQDTSAGQIALLERLTSGFMPDDGRTVFLVGDPMQSVYRFREADVALFLKVRDEGLGSLPIRSLVLERNFRSQPVLVNWVNRVFSRVFAAQDDLRSGAVRYSPARAREVPEIHPGVHLVPLVNASPLEEGRAVAQLIQALQRDEPSASIAVLGRARKHLATVAQALTAQNIPFQGVELMHLKDRLAVRDLVSLTRAVCHLGDREAWIACLRAPFCGLGLSDLYLLLAGDSRALVHDLSLDPSRLALIDANAQSRLLRTVQLIDAARQDRGRRRLAACIESLWLALGGPATLEDSADLTNVETFWARLDELEHGGDLEDPARLMDQLAKLYAATDPKATDRLQLMTVHHAKGLEWDHVILVGLSRDVQADKAQLLHWQSWERSADDPALVLAPVRARASTEEPIQEWIAQLEKTRAQHERKRLLYVATTRAIRSLHLVASVEQREDGTYKSAPAQSALGVLEPGLEGEWEQALSRAVPYVRAPITSHTPHLLSQRLISGWTTPQPEERLRLQSRSFTPTEGPQFIWVSEPARHAGTLVHEELAFWVASQNRVARPQHWRRRLREAGLSNGDLDTAARRVELALEAIAKDPRGQWILRNDHLASACELALSGIDAGEVVNIVIDRTFIDEKGIRWIIDYKTSSHEGAGLEAFLDEQKNRYQAQLERYARLMSRYDPHHPQRLALYFPLLQGWREWQPAPAQS